MTLPRLHIGDKNYSSWSMRPWLALKAGGVAFEEVQESLTDDGAALPAFGHISPNARVPALDLGGGAVIAESLAICEWAAEKAPQLWPGDAKERALARSAAAIMHSGFAALRAQCPMNIRRPAGPARGLLETGLADAKMCDGLWSGWLARSGGPFLFGRYSIADAMYAPVVTRFVTYALPRSPAAERYIATASSEPNFAAWSEAARRETRQLPRADIA